MIYLIKLFLVNLTSVPVFCSIYMENSGGKCNIYSISSASWNSWWKNMLWLKFPKKQSTFCRASALPDEPSDCGCLCQGKSILHQLMLAKHWTVKFQFLWDENQSEDCCASILEMCFQSSCWKSIFYFTAGLLWMTLCIPSFWA